MAKRKLTEERRMYLRWKISEQRRKIKQKAIEYKGGACEKCSYSRSIRSLVFHHLDPEEKDFSISHPISKKWNLIKLELDKCVLLCTNCHGEIHEEWDKIKNEESFLKLRKFVPEKIPEIGSIHKQCFNCAKDIRLYKSAENKRNFCSRKCSNDFLHKSVWDSDQIMIEEIKNLTIKELCLKYNRSKSTVYSYIKFLKEKYKI